jgi:putative nucleotidyltransferase with HDIG domain
MRELLLEKLPEIGQITDHGLRAKTLAVFADALTLGGWTVADLDRLPCTLKIPNNPVSLLTHVRSVVETTLKIADVLESYYGAYYHMDRDILRCGALLHDVGKLLEYAEAEQQIVKSADGHLVPHPISGAALALKHGLPSEVIHIIALHQSADDLKYRTPAAIIVRHASAVNFDPLLELLK